MIIGNSRGYVSIWNINDIIEEALTEEKISPFHVSQKIHDNAITVLRFNNQGNFSLLKRDIFLLI